MKFWNKSLAAILALAVAIVAWRTSPDIGQLIKSHASPSHAVAADPAKVPAVTTLILAGQPYACRDTGSAVVTCTIPRGLALGGRRHG
jgi:hypothetical protein